MVSAVPNILSWFLVALGSSSITILLMSRFIQIFCAVKMSYDILRVRICAGMAFGLLAGNVFLVHTASNNNLGSLKMVEVNIENHVKRNENIFI